MKTEAEKRAGAQRRARKYYHNKRKFYFQTPAGQRQRRRENLKKYYGIALEEWETLFVSQGSVCAACGSAAHNQKNWHTDHCHATKIVRGILCSGCNQALGYMRENADAIRGLARYIERFQCAQD